MISFPLIQYSTAALYFDQQSTDSPRLRSRRGNIWCFRCDKNDVISCYSLIFFFGFNLIIITSPLFHKTFLFLNLPFFFHPSYSASPSFFTYLPTYLPTLRLSVVPSNFPPFLPSIIWYFIIYYSHVFGNLNILQFWKLVMDSWK